MPVRLINMIEATSETTAYSAEATATQKIPPVELRMYCASTGVPPPISSEHSWYASDSPV